MTFKPVYVAAPVFSLFFLCFVAFFIFVLFKICCRLGNHSSDFNVIPEYAWNPTHPTTHSTSNPNYYYPYPQPYVPAQNTAQLVPGLVVSVYPDCGSVPGYVQYPR
ncbi:hypothetical protein RF11_02781 [Thelohanellus kitauei]|uniref:Uncharacterized protein n=1 Tax=Thelohanellus kitauei TaxID=669202 RepID=A0A0C2MQ32_THEKT|nr:hypothetical protein RF11_02781 [Thelohanellus kitauei]